MTVVFALCPTPPTCADSPEEEDSLEAALDELAGTTATHVKSASTLPPSLPITFKTTHV